MFKHLLDFSYKRDWKQAIIFFVVLFLIGIILPVVVSIIDSILFPLSASFDRGVQIGFYGAVIFNLIIACLLIKGKRFYKNIYYLLLTILCPFLGLLGLGITAEAILAFLTTKKIVQQDIPTVPVN